MVMINSISCAKPRTISVPKRCTATKVSFVKLVNMRNFNLMGRMTSSSHVSFFPLKNQIRSFSTVRPPKASTGLTGLHVEPNWKPELISLYNQLLRDLELLPENTAWRKMYEKITHYRLGIVEREDDWLKVEELIQAGSVEQLIHQAKQDISCIPVLLRLKPWDFDPDTHDAPIIHLQKDQ